MKRAYFSVILIFVWVAPACPQVIPLRVLLSATMKHAPSLRVDSASMEIARSNEKAFYNVGLPNLKLNYQANLGTNNNVPGGYFSFGVVPGNSRVREEANTSTILSSLGIVAFDWEVFNFGGFGAAKRVAHAEVQSGEALFEQRKYMLQARAIYYYFDLLMLLELQDIQLRNIKRNQEILRSIRSLARSGVIAGVDTSIANAELSRARQQYYELTGQYKKTQLQLSAQSGIDADGLAPDTTYTNRILAFIQPATLSTADSSAHPLLRYYATQLSTSRLQEYLIQKNYNPKLLLQAAFWGRGASVTAADEFRSLNSGFDLTRTNYLVGLGITYNVFDNWRKHLQLGVQRAATHVAIERLAEQKASLNLDLQESTIEFEVARQRLGETPQQLSAARAAYRQKFSLYKNGLTNIVDLNAALFSLYRAETDLINARYAFCEAVFKRAVIENRVEEILNLLN